MLCCGSRVSENHSMCRRGGERHLGAVTLPPQSCTLLVTIKTCMEISIQVKLSISTVYDRYQTTEHNPRIGSKNLYGLSLELRPLLFADRSLLLTSHAWSMDVSVSRLHGAAHCKHLMHAHTEILCSVPANLLVAAKLSVATMTYFVH